jgi:outer membrane protein assembly factor BamD
MKIFYKVIVIIIILSLQSCSKKEEKISKITSLNQDDELIKTYNEALESLNNGDPYYAGLKFLEAELAYPQSIWAAKSLLMASYSYYLQEDYVEARFHLERYLKSYPNDVNIIYAHYLIAMTHYDTIVDEKTDLKPLTNAKDKFNNIIKNYPNTEFAADSKYKINYINEVLASKEMYLGRFYIKKKKWIPAINRFKTIVIKYDTSEVVEEALLRLIEVYYIIGLEEESKKYANILGYNYQSSEWYKYSYEIFNKKYTNSIQKKKKIDLLKKFRKLFD